MRSEKTTWYLLTNLPVPGSQRAQQSPLASADLAEVVRLYGLRVWVEQSYKQVKGTLGWAEYRTMLAAMRGELAEEQVQWLPQDQAWESLEREGNKDRGRELIRQLGCGGCHRIPGITGARGTVGPPLTDWAKRHYIAGTLVNSPSNLVPWIMNPQQVEPKTVMPNLGVSEEEAWSIARFLYSLGREDAALRR